MKTFIVAVIAFAILLGAIVANCVFIQRTMDGLDARLSTLASKEDLVEAESFWKEHRRVITLSVSFDRIREMENCFAQMRAAIEEDDTLELNSARYLARNVVASIRSPERFCMECIL